MKTTNSVMRESEIELLEKTVEDIMVESSCEPDGERLWVKTSYELADLCRPIISHSLAEARREERERIVSIVSKIPDKEWVRLTTENLFDLLTGDNQLSEHDLELIKEGRAMSDFDTRRGE